MFSSHTIFAVLSVMATWDYFPFPGTKGFSTACLVILVPFTLASRKHYSVDVFTSLYVVPVIYELMKLKFPDEDSVLDFEGKYGIRFSQDPDPLCYSVTIRKAKFPIHMDQLPRGFRPSVTSFDIRGGGEEVEGNYKEDSYTTVRTESDSPPSRHLRENIITVRGKDLGGLGV